jgi:hypothetical protein
MLTHGLFAKQQLDNRTSKRIFRHVEAIRKRLASIPPSEFPKLTTAPIAPCVRAKSNKGAIKMTHIDSLPIELDSVVYACFPTKDNLNAYYWGIVIRVRDHGEYDVWFADNDVRVNIPREDVHPSSEVVRSFAPQHYQLKQSHHIREILMRIRFLTTSMI